MLNKNRWVLLMVLIVGSLCALVVVSLGGWRIW